MEGRRRTCPSGVKWLVSLHAEAPFTDTKLSVLPEYCNIDVVIFFYVLSFTQDLLVANEGA